MHVMHFYVYETENFHVSHEVRSVKKTYNFCLFVRFVWQTYKLTRRPYYGISRGQVVILLGIRVVLNSFVTVMCSSVVFYCEIVVVMLCCL